MSSKRPRSLLLLTMVLFVSFPGDIPLAAGFVPPITASDLLGLPRSSYHPSSSSSSYPGEQPSSRLAAVQAPSAAVHTKLLTSPNNNCNYHRYRGRRTIPTCTAAVGSSSSSSSTGDDALPGAGGGGTVTAAGASSAATAVVSSSPSAVITAAEEEGNEQKGGGGGVVVGSTSNPDVGLVDPFADVAPGAGAARAAAGGWAAAAAGSLAPDVEWEGAEGAVWTEFEDWLVQDTYSRYVIGSGKHVLWRRMVREVPELMERTPQEARQRWLRLTGRLGDAGAEDGRGEGGGHKKAPGSPALDAFYMQPPVLEQWEEIVEGEGMGSFRGNVFGQRGLADGTAMTTAPVDVSGRKIQDQYVATQCGVVYELGERRETDLVAKASSKMLKIAPATVLALAGAFYAFTALSHHVQVEVFVI